MMESMLRAWLPVCAASPSELETSGSVGSSSSFPSLSIRGDGVHARGAFAENQAQFLNPDREGVATLDALLSSKKIGIVAHFYMDAELQGVLAACTWPHIHVSDSLAMADAAVGMVEAGAKAIVVLGVDFMSENVRAMLDAAGHADTPVYRVASDAIGCSLAEAAETETYREWLEQAASTAPALHVVYINTSLAVKARAQSILPTITCTSSNVVQTILSAWAEQPELNIWYGPDTYMGENLHSMFQAMTAMDDAQIAKIHPSHDRASIAKGLEHYHWFKAGACIVHHMFGADVVRRVRRDHPRAYVTAHFEVPGEMFALGFEAQNEGRGVVGSTSNILNFINQRVEVAAKDKPETLSFVLGTEAGMITPIVNQVRERLRDMGSDNEVEIIFPVASEAVAQTDDPDFAVVPGVASGEGCSVAGGCATCPYMKMNSLDALADLVARVDVDSAERLASFEPHLYEETIDGKSMAALGSIPILHMRAFQKTGRLGAELVAELQTRNR